MPERTETYEVAAHAKINLFLRLCGRLPNGYHKLFTVMQELELCDDISMTFTEGKRGSIKVSCPGRPDIKPEKNLCYKACDRFYAAYRKKRIAEGENPRDIVFDYTEIEINKRIPSESGMGGGSSDAAGVLMIMQEHYGNPFTEEELLRLAVNVGADVPFFLYGGTCLCENVGEEITVLGSCGGLGVVIAKPSEGVSTPACFAGADRMGEQVFDAGAYGKFTEEFTTKESASYDDIVRYRELFLNDLEKPALEIVPKINTVIETVASSGAGISHMTGSGSAVFGIYESREAAEKAADVIRGREDLKDCVVIVTETV